MPELLVELLQSLQERFSKPDNLRTQPLSNITKRSFVFIRLEVIPPLERGLSDNFHSEIRIDREIENEPAY